MPHPAIINPPDPVKPRERYTRELPSKTEPVKRKPKRRTAEAKLKRKQRRAAKARRKARLSL